VNFNKPVDEDGPHFVVYLALARHVVGAGMVQLLRPQQVIKYFLAVLGAILGRLDILLTICVIIADAA
jgi:hypothetical protein